MKRVPIGDDLEILSSELSEGLKSALRLARAIMEERVREGGVTADDLDDHQLLEDLTDAFIEAAPAAYAGMHRDAVRKVLRTMLSTIVLDLSAQAGSRRSIH